MNIKPGHEKEYLEACAATYQIANGFLGWSGQAKMLIGLGLGPMFGVTKGRRRVKIKKVKRRLQAAMWQNIMEHVVDG